MGKTALKAVNPRNQLHTLSRGLLRVCWKALRILLNVLRCIVWSMLACFICFVVPIFIGNAAEHIPHSEQKVLYGYVIILVSDLVIIYVMFLLWPFKAKKVPKPLKLEVRYKKFRYRKEFRKLLAQYVLQAWKHAYIPSPNRTLKRVFSQCSAKSIFSEVFSKVKPEIAYTEKRLLRHKKLTGLFRAVVRCVLAIVLLSYNKEVFDFIINFFSKDTKVRFDYCFVLLCILLFLTPFFLSISSIFNVRIIMEMGKFKTILSFITISLQIQFWNSLCTSQFKEDYEYIRAFQRFIAGDMGAAFSLSLLLWILILFFRKSLVNLFKKEETFEKDLQLSIKEHALSLWDSMLDSLKGKIQLLLELWDILHAQLFYSFLQRWWGCTSAGGLPASSEQHGLSLLSVQLSTISGFASLYFSLANTTKRGGRNYGPVFM